jgi:hypothetical protein
MGFQLNDGHKAPHYGIFTGLVLIRGEWCKKGLTTSLVFEAAKPGFCFLETVLILSGTIGGKNIEGVGGGSCRLFVKKEGRSDYEDEPGKEISGGRTVRDRGILNGFVCGIFGFVGDLHSSVP